MSGKPLLTPVFMSIMAFVAAIAGFNEAASAQMGYVYIKNQGTPNSVSAFAQDGGGALTAVPGSPFTTGGNSNFNNNMKSITVIPSRRLLYVSNTDSATVAGFTINGNGSLTAVPGSPFATGASPIGVSSDPGGRFVYVANHNAGSVSVYSIAGNGALTPVAGSPFVTAVGCWMIDVHPSGNYIYAVSRTSGDRINGFSVSATGALTPVPGSPYTPGLGNSHGSAMTPDGRFLYMQSFGASNIFGYSVSSADGSLTPVPGSPFAGGLCYQGLSVNPAGSFLFNLNSSNSTINSFAIAANGALSAVAGSPFPNSAGASTPTQTVVSPDGRFLVASNHGSTNVSVFDIAVSGALSSHAGSPYAGKVGTNCAAVAYFDPNASPLGVWSDSSSSDGPQGGPFTPAAITYTLMNFGAAPLDWTAAKTAAWLDTPMPASGTLAAGDSTTVTIAVNTNANGLAVGTYSDNVVFANTTAGTSSPRTFVLNVWPPVDVTVNQVPAQPDPTAVTPINFDVQFSEGVSGFTDASLPGGDVQFAGTATVAGYSIIPNGQPAPASVDYEILNTCSSGDVYTFYLNGGMLGSTTSNLGGSCTCTPGLQTYTVSNAGAIASLWIVGAPNTFRVTKTGTATLFAWVRAQLHFASTTQMLPIYDLGASGCTDVNLCDAPYNSNTFDHSVTATFGDPSKYTISVTSVSQDGTVIPVIPAGAGQSLAHPVVSNRVSTSTDSSVLYDTTPPTVDVVDATPDPRNVPVTSVDFAFSEPVQGFLASDISLTLDGGANLLTGAEPLSTSDGITWTLDGIGGLTAAAGHYVVSTGTGAIMDLLGHPLTAGADDAWDVDLTPLTATIEPLGNNPTGADAVDFTVTFSAPVTPTLTDADITLDGSLAGAAAVTLSDTNPVYTVTVTMTDPNADGTIGITIPPNVVWTLANNQYAGGSSALVGIYNWRGFAQQPQNARAYVGDFHQFDVQPDCDSPVLAYQWKWDDGAKAIHDGPTTPFWDVAGLTAASDGNQYWCEVTYDGVTHVSDHAVLSVREHMTFAAQPQGGAALTGGNHTFSVIAEKGYTPYSYQWKKDGSDILNEGNASLVLTSLELTDTGTYSVDVWDFNGELHQSDPAILTVTQGVPAAGLMGLAALASACAALGMRKSRRR